MTRPLQEGDELHCPHCGRWHTVISKHHTGTEYAMNMLYWRCRRGDYYAGQIGVPSRHKTRPATTVHRT